MPETVERDLPALDTPVADVAHCGQPAGVRMPDGRVWNPLGKVVNRFEAGGAEDSLRLFFLTLHGRTRKVPAELMS
ncbi:hypothetical protein [Streptomyces sp. NPDC001037]|uniref:hypothetical protein n=1 Tax=Streptomyces sp. NPDC001037 TaxID=3364542 RepID=UPI003684EBC4